LQDLSSLDLGDGPAQSASRTLAVTGALEQAAPTVD